MGASTNCTFAALSLGGAYSQAAVKVSSPASNLLFEACSAHNGSGGTVWDVQSGLTNVTFVVCNH